MVLYKRLRVTVRIPLSKSQSTNIGRHVLNHGFSVSVIMPLEVLIYKYTQILWYLHLILRLIVYVDVNSIQLSKYLICTNLLLSVFTVSLLSSKYFLTLSKSPFSVFSTSVDSSGLHAYSISVSSTNMVTRFFTATLGRWLR